MAGKSRSLLALISLLFLSGTIILLFLLILAGAYDGFPLNRIFWLQADTRGIPNAPNGITHWTLYNHCDERNGVNVNCGPNNAAYPLLPQRNFNTQQNIPADFIRNPDKYFYLSKFLYSFYIIDVFFAITALAAGLLAVFRGYAGIAAAACSSCSLFCMAFSASIMTACYVMGAKALRADGRFAKVGVKAFAFTWACVAFLAIATIGFAMSWTAGKRKRERYGAGRQTRRMKGGLGRGFVKHHGHDDRSSYAETAESQRKFNKGHM